MRHWCARRPRTLRLVQLRRRRTPRPAQLRRFPHVSVGDDAEDDDGNDDD